MTSTTILETLDSKGIKDFKHVFTETLDPGLQVITACMAVEKIFHSLYLRSFPDKAIYNGRFPNLHEIATELYTKKKITYEVQGASDFIRQSRIATYHKTFEPSLKFGDGTKYYLYLIFSWYAKKFRNDWEIELKPYQHYGNTSLNINPITLLSELKNNNYISQHLYEKLIGELGFLNYSSSVVKCLTTPIYLILIIDCSGSMKHEAIDVIEAHKEAINAVRESRACKSNRLFLAQYLFSDNSRVINTLTKIDRNGNDEIKYLADEYKPNGVTALYKTVYEALFQLSLEMREYRKIKGNSPRAIIAVLTDAEDNNSGEFTAADVKDILRVEEQQHRILGSTVIGWNSNKFNEQQLESLRFKIGFEKSFSIDRNKPNSIRDALFLWSQSVNEAANKS